MKVNVLSRRWLSIVIAMLIALGAIASFQIAKASNDEVCITYDANGGSFSDTGKTVKKVQEQRGFPIYPSASAVPYLIAPDKSTFIGWSRDKNDATGGPYDIYCPESDETFYAIWKKYDVKVTFDAGRGFFDGDNQKHKSDAYKSNEDNSWEGYPDTPEWSNSTKVFDGWYTAEDYSSGKIEDPWTYGFTEDTVLYAKWIDTVTVTYNFNGGSNWDGKATETETVGKGKEIYIWKSFDKSPKPNQVISGWYDNPALKGLKINDYAAFDEDVTLYAKWVDTWKVTIDMGDGKNKYGLPEALIEKGQDGTLRVEPEENPLQDGRYYAGVYTGPNGTGDAVSVYSEMKPQNSMDGGSVDWVADYITYMPTKDTTLYAYWAKPIDLVFDANGGTIDDKGTTTKEYTTSTLPGIKLYNIVPVITERPGYMFLGWATDKEGKNIVDYEANINKSTTLYASWGDGYRITFDANGGRFWRDSQSEISVIEKGKPIAVYDLKYVECAPSVGQVFAGWYYDKACTKEFTGVNSYIPTTDLTLYAGWTKGVKLTFDANGGSFYGDTKESKVATETQYIAKGNRADYLVPPDEAPVGKSFAGWYLDKQLTKAIDRKTTFTKDTILYAKWVDSVRLVMDANGGEFSGDERLSTSTITTAPGEPIDNFRFDYGRPTRNGFYFAGWFYDRAGTNPFNPSGEDIAILQDTTIYAKWIEGDPNVTISYYVGNVKVGEDSAWREMNGTLPDYMVHYTVSEWKYDQLEIDPKLNGIQTKWYFDKQRTKPLTATSEVKDKAKVYGTLTERHTVTFHTVANGTVDVYPYYCENNQAFVDSGTKMGDLLSELSTYREGNHPEIIHMGWTGDSAGKKDIDVNTVISSDMDLYEKTTEGVITTLDFGEGEWVAYAFDGATSTTIITENNKPLAEGVFEAPWMNAEKLQRGDNFYHYGNKLFQGWYEDRACTKKVRNLADYVPKADTTLYAKWARYDESTEPVNPSPETPDEPTPPAPNDKQSGVIQGADGKWALYKDGKVQNSYTGIAQNNFGWWRIVEGYVDFNATGIYQNEFGWWRVENGKVNFEADGVYRNEYGWWKTTDGKVTFHETGIYQNENGWWRTVDSKVDFSANGIYQNEFGWWKTTNGKVTFVEDGVYQNEYGWWKVDDSKVDFHFTGIAKNKFGSWYVKNGKVDFSKNGKVSFEGKTYTIKDGKVV